jgi:hypothetical protein
VHCTSSASRFGALRATSVPAGWPATLHPASVSTKRSASLDDAIGEVLRAFALARPDQGYRKAYRALCEAG